jgi:hypothetical protein
MYTFNVTVLFQFPSISAVQELEVLELENLAAETRENANKFILNMDLLIPLPTTSSAHNV